MELEHVHQVYEVIAEHFDRTRYSYWNQVRRFLDQLPAGSLVLDNGCGNGKYLTYRKDLEMVGLDPCKAFVDLCRSKYSGTVIQGNGLSLPFRQNIFDAAISIAVLHHLSTPDTRHQFLCEMIRSMKPGAYGLVTVWAKEQEYATLIKKWEALETPNDYLVPWCHPNGTCLSKRYYHLFDQEEVQQLFQSIPNLSIQSILFEKSNWCIVFSKNSLDI